MFLFFYYNFFLTPNPLSLTPLPPHRQTVHGITDKFIGQFFRVARIFPHMLLASLLWSAFSSLFIIMLFFSILYTPPPTPTHTRRFLVNFSADDLLPWVVMATEMMFTPNDFSSSTSRSCSSSTASCNHYIITPVSDFVVFFFLFSFFVSLVVL